MAYVPDNFNLLVQSISGPKLWHYRALADAQLVIRVANFFTDAHLKGVSAGDLVMVSYGSFAGSIHAFNSVGAGANDLTDGLAVLSTDTD